MPGLKERAKTVLELIEGAAFLFAKRPLVMDEKAAAILDDGGHQVIAEVMAQLAGAGEWNAASRRDGRARFCRKRGLKLGKVAQPLRAALTGRAVSPPVFDVMAVLGREESLARLADQAKPA